MTRTLGCVYYIHGGGMASMSCYDGMYRGWGKIIAANGVAVAMVDFRNCVSPSSVPEVAPFPAGLNDCVSGLKWVVANAAQLGIDPARIVVAGESGGGNLTLATGLKLKQDGDLGLIKGLYAMCPYIAGQWPTPESPSSTENNGILSICTTTAARWATGSRLSTRGNPLAWPGFATEADVSRAAADRHQRQRVRSAARRGRELLPAAAAGRRCGAVPAGHGHDARHRDLQHRLPRDQPRHGPRHGGVLHGLMLTWGLPG